MSSVINFLVKQLAKLPLKWRPKVLIFLAALGFVTFFYGESESIVWLALVGIAIFLVPVAIVIDIIFGKRQL